MRADTSPILHQYQTSGGGFTKADAVRLAVDSLQQAGAEVTDSADTADDLAATAPVYELGHRHHQFVGRRVSFAAAPAVNGGPLAAEEAGRALRHLLSRQEAEESGGRTALDEWRQVALAADRILFWFFLVITTLSSLLFLVVLPVHKRSQYQRPD